MQNRIRFARAGSALAAAALALAGCPSDGADGKDGKDGQNGANGMNGADGMNGGNGTDGQPGQPGEPGEDALVPVDPSAPLSSVVAAAFVDDEGTGAGNIADFVKARVQQVATGTLPAGVQFPLSPASTDTVRGVAGLRTNVVVKWLDPITWKDDAFAPRFGANADYIAYFGDGWDVDWSGGVVGSPPQWNGSANAGFIWVNHEYVSGTTPLLTAPPTNQQLTLARFARFFGFVTHDVRGVWPQTAVDAHVDLAKKQVGGSWVKVVQDPATGEWSLDRAAANLRYDGSESTLTRITGTTVKSGPDRGPTGLDLPAGVATGMLGNCSGGQTPWGTVISAEENVQDYYGDLEASWDSNQKLITGVGFDTGANINPTLTPSTAGEYGMHSNGNSLHARDLYGYLIEVDPGVKSDEFIGKATAGRGHAKLGVMGRARWENATVVTDAGWKLVPGQKIVIYSGDDRRSGRIYKWVSAAPYTAGMSKAQVRALLDDGTLYVGHLAGLDNTKGDVMADGTSVVDEPGQWIELSVDNTTQDAPNAAALGAPGTKVGAALKNTSYNRLGGFASDDDVRMALFTASNKLGIMELNRPEDLEFNPIDGRLYIAFTNHNRRTALDPQGRVWDPATHGMMSVVRPDTTGSLFALAETGDPESSLTFTFSKVWAGTKGKGAFDAANIDNVMIDADGGVWFGTDGNFGTNGHADALYYLDLDPANAAGQPGVVSATFGKAFRVLAAPSDAELTGPAFSSDMRSIFFSVQHPGEGVPSTWPPR